MNERYKLKIESYVYICNRVSSTKFCTKKMLQKPDKDSNVEDNDRIKISKIKNAINLN